MPSRTNTLAIVSLVSGIVAWFAMPVIGSIVAIVTGHMARKQIRESHGREEGSGFALAGLLLGYFSLLAGIIAVIVTILVIMGTIGLGFLAALTG